MFLVRMKVIVSSLILPRHVDDLFGLKKILLEVVAQVVGDVGFVQFFHFFIHVTTFQVKDAVLEFVEILPFDFSFHPGPCELLPC